jgi:hypothetical protein
MHSQGAERSRKFKAMILTVLKSKFYFKKMSPKHAFQKNPQAGIDFLLMHNVMKTFPPSEYKEWSTKWLPAQVREIDLMEERGIDKHLYKKKLEFTRALASTEGLQL